MSLLLLLTTSAFADVKISGRQVVILNSSVDQVVGMYLFAYENNSPQPEKFSDDFSLPIETVDWKVAEGIDEKEVTLNTDGSIKIAHQFKPGTSLIGIHFIIPAKFGKSQMTFIPKQNIEDLTIMTPINGLGLNSSQFEMVPRLDFSDRVFRGLRAKDIKSGQKLEIQIDNLPEGRAKLWILGSVIGSFIVFSALVLAWRSRPNLKENVFV